MSTSPTLTVRLAVALLAALVLSACGGGHDTKDDGGPAGRQAARIVGTTLIFGIDGVALGVPDDMALAASDVTIAPASLPVAALPASAVAAGTVYQVRANSHLDAPAGTQFMVGLPVPPGEDPARLALAVLLSPTSGVLAARNTAAALPDFWAFLPLAHEAGSDMVFAPSGSITPDGTVFRLVRLPAAGTTTAAARSRRSILAAGDAAEPLPDPLVKAMCAQGFVAPNVCDSDSEFFTEAMVEDVIRKLHSLGYQPPRLLRQVTLAPQAGGGVLLELGPYLVEIVPCESTGSGYFMEEQNLVLCKPADDDSPDGLEVDFLSFVAAEFGYPNMVGGARDDGDAVSWFVESMATASVRSLPHVDRGLLVRHARIQPKDPANVLASRDRGAADLRSAQDFWVFLGARSNGLGLRLFPNFLGSGPRLADVDHILAGEGGLGAVYFEWAKNQIYERTVEVVWAGSDGTAFHLSGTACSHQFVAELSDSGETWHSNVGTPDVGATGTFDPDHGPWLDQALAWPSDHVELGPNRASLSIEPMQPLTARAYRIWLQAPHGYAVRVAVEPGATTIAYKIYDEAQDGAEWHDGLPPGCADDPSNTDRIVEVAQEKPVSVLVLIAETALRADTGPLPVPATKIVIEKIGLSLEPATEAFSVEENETYVDTFTIHNHTSVPVGYLAVENADWLRIVPGDDSGTVPANGSVVVSYEATCPNPSDATDVSLLFNDANGNPISGPDVPSAFRLTGACVTPPRACIDPGKFDGYTATATFSWADWGTVGDVAYSQTHSVQVSTTWQLSTNTIVSRGSGSVIQETTVTTNGVPATTKHRGSGEAFSGLNPVTRGPALIAATYNAESCVWSVSIMPSYIDGETILFDGTSTPAVLQTHGEVGVYNVAAAGNAQLKSKCSSTEYKDTLECAIGSFSAGSIRPVRLGDPPYEVPDALFSWVVTPIVKP